jgi:hypothetical protein
MKSLQKIVGRVEKAVTVRAESAQAIRGGIIVKDRSGQLKNFSREVRLLRLDLTICMKG